MAFMLCTSKAHCCAPPAPLKAVTTLSACAEGTLTTFTTVFPSMRLPKPLRVSGEKKAKSCGCRRALTTRLKSAKASGVKPLRRASAVNCWVSSCRCCVTNLFQRSIRRRCSCFPGIKRSENACALRSNASSTFAPDVAKYTCVVPGCSFRIRPKSINKAFCSGFR